MSRQKDLEMLRHAVNDELNAVSYYEASMREAEDEHARELFHHIATEEKEHVAELMEAIRRLDKEQEGKLGEYLELGSSAPTASIGTMKGEER